MPLYEFGESVPYVAPTAFIAPNAILVGRVRVAERSSVWFGATLRGDIEPIEVAAGSNVQDGVVMHTDPGFPLHVGSSVTVGHQAVLHGCTVGGGSLIGIGAIVLSGAVIGRECLVGAATHVTEGKVFPDRSLVLGIPARRVRTLSEEEVAKLRLTAQDYVRRSDVHLRSSSIRERG